MCGEQIKIREYENASHIWIIEKLDSEELAKQAYKDIISLINE